MTAKPASRLSQYVFVLSTLAIWAVFLKAIFSDTGLVAMMADEDKLLGSIRLWALVATPKRSNTRASRATPAPNMYRSLPTKL